MITTTRSEKETEQFAREFARSAVPGTVVALRGDLGAGKTVFARGVARGLGIDSPVLSPTFTLLRQYESGRLPLFHFDLYRIGDESELDEIGFTEALEAGGVVLCEWPDRAGSELPSARTDVFIEALGPEERKITLEERM